MYLTRITLSPTAFRARHLLGSPQNLHAALAASFPVSGDKNADGSPVERILWRLDHSTTQPEPVLFVASPAGPDMNEAAERITTPDRIVTKHYAPVLAAVAAGDVYSFRLAANPTRYQRRDTKTEAANGHIHTHDRVPLHRHDQQVDWLARKLSDAGAEPRLTTGGNDTGVADVIVDGERSYTFTRHDPNRQRRAAATVKRVDFKGHLTVTDPARFRAALTHGIGPAKGYGCGLLTIARPLTKITNRK